MPHGGITDVTYDINIALSWVCKRKQVWRLYKSKGQLRIWRALQNDQNIEG